MFKNLYRTFQVYADLSEPQRAAVRMHVRTIPYPELSLILCDAKTAGLLNHARKLDPALNRVVVRRLNAPLLIVAAGVAAVSATVGPIS
jgi:hypothetical protein